MMRCVGWTLLCVVLVLTLCACDGIVAEANGYTGPTETTFVSSAPVGSSSGWSVGSVAPESVINSRTLPTATHNIKMVVAAEFKNGAILKLSAIHAGDYEASEIETKYEANSMLSRQFKVDNEQYFYTSYTENGVKVENVWHIHQENVQSNTTNEFTDDSIIIRAMEKPDDTAEKFTLCEYVELLGGYDVFDAQTRDGSKIQIMIDHKSGRVTDMILKPDRDSDYKSMSVHIYYDVDASEFDMDISEAEEDENGTYGWYIFAQLLLLSGVVNSN